MLTSRHHTFALALTLLSPLACSSSDDADAASEPPAQAAASDAGFDAEVNRVDSGTGVAADSGSRELDAMVNPRLRDASADAGQPVTDADGGDEDVSMTEPVQAP